MGVNICCIHFLEEDQPMNANPCTMHVSQFELCKQIYTCEIFSKFKLSPSARLVLVALANHYNPDKKDMFPSQEFLAQKLYMSVKSVQRAVAELRQKGLIIYETKKFNRYVFTNIFFASLELSGNRRQNVSETSVKMSPKQIKEQKKNNNNFKNFKSFSSEKSDYQRSDYQRNYAVQGSSVSQNNRKNQVEETKKLIEQTYNVEVKSPMDDLETAITWLNSLNEVHLKHSFIRQRVEKVCEKWGLEPECLKQL